MRDLLASNRTLLAWLRTSLGFAGLGFAVARFGLVAGQRRTAGLLGMLMVLAGMSFMILGLIQHLSTVAQEHPAPESPQPLRWPPLVAACCGTLVCALLAIYIATSTL
jgi:uncharacterized membrane protein YidH (DUF202 family)